MFAKEMEIHAWLFAAIFMIILSITVFMVQRLAGPFLDLVFEICIFYIPAFMTVNFFLYFRRKLK